MLNKIIKYINLYISSKMPIYKFCVFFSSFQGMYNDNPRRISEKLHEEYPALEQYWAISKKRCSEEIPKYIHCVDVESNQYWRLSMRAQIIVDNTFGMRSSYVKRGTIVYLWRKIYSLKKKGQFCVATWHGTPMKHIALDDPVSKDVDMILSNADYVIAGCNYTKKIFEKATKNSIPVKMYGTPRNDILFESGVDIQGLKKKLKLPEDKKIILFAPTFRDGSIEQSGLQQFRSIDVQCLLQKMHDRFGGEWVFVFRAHNFVMLELDAPKTVLDGNIGDDMAEYLLCADALITDYSGSMYDYALTEKPCFLYAPDIQQYEKERGLYIDYRTLPFPKAYSFNELLDCITNFDLDRHKENMRLFLEKIGNVEDGHASERIVDDIIAFIKTNYMSK